MTLDEMVYAIWEETRGGKISDDDTISQELLEEMIVTYRADLIRKDQGKGRSLSDNIMQTLSCVPVIQVDATECCDITTDCTVVRSVTTIPKFVELYQKDLMTKVAGANIMSTGWSIISYHRAIYAGASQWTKGSTKAFLKNRYLYILNPPNGLDTVSVSGVFEDPRDAAIFANCTGTPCYTSESEFPMSAWMIPIVKDLIFKNDMRILAPNLTDDKGNEKNDAGGGQNAK
jgi:hypothetical protein